MVALCFIHLHSSSICCIPHLVESSWTSRANMGKPYRNRVSTGGQICFQHRHRCLQFDAVSKLKGQDSQVYLFLAILFTHLAHTEYASNSVDAGTHVLKKWIFREGQIPLSSQPVSQVPPFYSEKWLRHAAPL